jgi:hypothetical protein
MWRRFRSRRIETEPKRFGHVVAMGTGEFMRYERAYARRQRAVTFVGSTRTITIPLETADFERLERLAIKRNLGNATLGREIIRKYLEQHADQRSRPRSAPVGPPVTV